MANNSTTTPIPEDRAAPSTRDRPWVQPGDTVLVRVDEGTYRPLIVAEVHPDRSVSGPICCTADDHTRPAFRGWQSKNGARIHGRPDRLLPMGYGEMLHPGSKLGEWISRPTNSPSGS